MENDAHPRTSGRVDADWQTNVTEALTGKDVARLDKLLHETPETMVGSPIWERARGWWAGYWAAATRKA